MKNINSFNIDENNLAAISTVRQFNVAGDEDAEFILQVFNSSQQFYDFKSRSFSATHTSTSSLKIKMKSSDYYGSIVFPANGSGDTYTILLIAPLDKDTEFSFGKGKYSYSTTITQVADVVLTFTPVTASSSSYQAFADTGAVSITSTSTPIAISSITKKLDWDVVNTNSDANGFGLRLIRQPTNTDWYFQTTEVISSNPAGDAVCNNTVIVADLTDIATGMELVYHKGTTAPSATTIITAINQSTKTITFSTSTAFEDGETMTLKAKGSSVIKKAIGADIDFSNWNANVESATSAELSKKVRSTASGNDIALVGTYGISGGGFVTVSGVNVNNTASNTVQVVTESSSAGSVLTEEAQQVKAGSKVYFTGSTQTVSIVNSFTINSHPTSNKTIYLNLDNFITPGISGD